MELGSIPAAIACRRSEGSTSWCTYRHPHEVNDAAADGRS